MIIPESRFNSNSRYYRKKSGKKWIIIVLLFAAAGAGIFLYLKPESDFTPEKKIESEKTYEQLWSEGNYKQLSKKCNLKLLDDPLDPLSLIYGGFSYFYLGAGQFTVEDKIALMSKSVIYLRKVLLLNPVPMKSKVEYILGKAYYNKGRYFLDLSIKYMKQSLADGYSADDSYKYLGLAYSELGLYSDGIKYFLDALKDNNDDLLNLVIGQTYYKMGDDVNAEKYLLTALDGTEGFASEQKIRFLLGKIYLDRNDFEKATEQYDKILEKNKNSADAHYYLGEIYSKLNKKVKARAEWRKALEIDPSHYGALLRLY